MYFKLRPNEMVVGGCRLALGHLGVTRDGTRDVTSHGARTRTTECHLKYDPYFKAVLRFEKFTLYFALFVCSKAQAQAYARAQLQRQFCP